MSNYLSAEHKFQIGDLVRLRNNDYQKLIIVEVRLTKIGEYKDYISYFVRTDDMRTVELCEIELELYIKKESANAVEQPKTVPSDSF